MKLKKLVSGALAALMLAGTLVVSVPAAESTSELPFDDVAASKWYSKAVTTVYNEGIMMGKSDTKFDPTANITRAEVVTAFARIACTNIDGYGDKLAFTDTKTGKWYSDSVGWAAEYGIVKGRGDGRFSPSDNITRAELASIIVNFINYMELKLPDDPKLDKFADADTFANWMKAPVEAVRKTGLMQGVNGKFNPKGNASRAEIAQVITNLIPSSGRVSVAENGKTDYVIVIDEESTAAKDAAERMVWQLEEICGVTVEIVDDSTKAVSHEIVLGKTVRGTKVDTSEMVRDEYAIAIDGEKIYVDGASADGLYGGAVSFMNTCISGDDLRFTSKSAYADKFEYPVGALTIAGNDISKYTVYYPADADGFVKTAAEDISHYIAEATGTVIPVKAGEPTGLYIAIETVKSDKEFDDSFTVRSKGDSIVISGHANLGAVYGAYDFLEDCIGVRYLEGGLDYIRPAEQIDVSNVDYSEAPAFEYYHYYDFNKVYENLIPGGITVKNKALRPLVWAGRSCHTFDDLDGDFSSQYVNQPCLTSDEVFERILENAKKTIENRIATDGKVDIISISQNDNTGYCTCENCMASYAKYAANPNEETSGGTAGNMIEFANRIAVELEKDYPNVKIHTFAYLYTQTPPKNIKAHKNVTVQLCPIYNCNNHPFTHNCSTNKKLQEHIKGWAEVVDEIQMWDYSSLNMGIRASLYPVYAYGDWSSNYAWFIENKVNYVFNNGAEPIDYPLRYLNLKVMWDPYLTEDEYYGYLEDYLRGYFGDGWKKAYDAIMMIEKKYDSCVVDDTPAKSMMHFYMASYIDDVVDLMTDALYLAETKAKFDRLDLAKLPYDWVQIDGAFQKLYNSKDPADDLILQEMCREYYTRYCRLGVRVSSHVPNPPMPERFEKSPSYWQEWAYKCIDPNGDGETGDRLYDETGNWLGDDFGW